MNRHITDEFTIRTVFQSIVQQSRLEYSRTFLPFCRTVRFLKSYNPTLTIFLCRTVTPLSIILFPTLPSLSRVLRSQYLY